jgi:hypothetical protein
VNIWELEVEGCLFKVPRGPFERNSEVFQDMFRLPVPENTVPDGSSDEHPLRLDGVKKNDFRQLLKVMFPGSVCFDKSCDGLIVKFQISPCG